jgi:hypothetical protein
MDGNQLLQQAVLLENRARGHRSYGQFEESNSKDNVSCVEQESASEDENKICVTEWVDTPKDKPIPSSFSRPNPGTKEEMKFTFDVSKSNKLLDVLVKGGVIRLAEGHVIPTPEQLARRKYCKWHDSYSHTTND